MSLHVIVGAGVIGSATAFQLAQRGHQVRVISRSGGGPIAPGIERVSIDATVADRLVEAASGAASLYNCANPPQYARWASDWPPLAAALLGAAERTGAVLVTMGNLYGYGPVDHPMTELDPLRATGKKGRLRASMWTDALAAQREGRLRTTEARASDYFGPGVLQQGHIGERSIPSVLDGRAVTVFGNPDLPHSWTYVNDVAVTLVTLGTDPRAWGRAWHVPTNPPMSQRQMLSAIARIGNASEPRLRTLPGWAFSALAKVVPYLYGTDEVLYQFERPFVMDSTEFQTTFGVQPTPMEEALRSTVAWWQTRRRAAA